METRAIQNPTAELPDPTHYYERKGRTGLHLFSTTALIEHVNHRMEIPSSDLRTILNGKVVITLISSRFKL